MGELNYHCINRIKFAREISQKILMQKGVEEIKAMAIGGSVARGFADEYSDIEILLFWSEFPNDTIRKNLIKKINAEFFYPYNYESGEDNLIINGLRIDLWHITIKKENEVLKSVTQDLDINYGSSNAMDTIRKCIPLYGEGIINPWKIEAQKYSNEYAIKNIENILKSIDSTQTDLYIHRKNVTLLFEQIINLQKNIFLLLLALNREYFPTFKWMYKGLKNLDIKPNNILKRFMDVFGYKPRKAYNDTLKIMHETINLVKKMYPEINTETALNKLNSARIAHI